MGKVLDKNWSAIVTHGNVFEIHLFCIKALTQFWSVRKMGGSFKSPMASQRCDQVLFNQISVAMFELV